MILLLDFALVFELVKQVPVAVFPLQHFNGAVIVQLLEVVAFIKGVVTLSFDFDVLGNFTPFFHDINSGKQCHIISFFNLMYQWVFVDGHKLKPDFSFAFTWQWLKHCQASFDSVVEIVPFLFGEILGINFFYPERIFILIKLATYHNHTSSLVIQKSTNIPFNQLPLLTLFCSQHQKRIL